MSEQKPEEKKIEVDIQSPFGPRIAIAKLPMHIVDNLNKFCDGLVEQKQEEKAKIDKSPNLVGHVTEELFCDMNHEGCHELGGILSGICKSMHNTYSEMKGIHEEAPPESINILDSWFVRSYDGDYNPCHIHTNCQYSCILYLKVPDSISDKNFRNAKETYTTEGYIDFIYGSNAVNTSSNFTRQPIVGDLYVFPAHLMHVAYPFFGEGERRSFSANIILEYPQQMSFNEADIEQKVDESVNG
tara:strand:+ start:209 stop:937 length:729 start_codon:yes stop_codon:yes gene_type:complete